MEKDKKPESKPRLAGVLRMAYHVEPGEDFVHRFLFGLGKMKDCVCDRSDRLAYDKSFGPVFQNLLEANFARKFAIDLLEKHAKDVDEGKDAVVQGHQINVNNPIDDKLNMFFKDFFIRGAIATDCLIKHTRHMGYDIGFLFSDGQDGKDKKFKKGLKRFPIPETDERFTRLRDAIKHVKQSWYSSFLKMRTQIEHDGYKLPEIKYHEENGKVIAMAPSFDGKSIQDVLDMSWENLSNLCEEIIVYIISLKLPDHLVIIMIPPEKRDKNLPVRFAIRHRDFPEADFSCS